MNPIDQRFARQLSCGDVLVITGAGCSTDSGIPDYRDDDGRWKRSQPMQWQMFRSSARARRRYWARSLVGWPTVADARPGKAHQVLAALESKGLLRWLVTQNVDGLHQRAGSRQVTDLHGRLDTVRCLQCQRVENRDLYQERLFDANPGWAAQPSSIRPDGDADIDDVQLDGFQVPGCRFCGEVVKPDVVFFGENVPRSRVESVSQQLADSRLLLVVGSSLMVWSGYRFVRMAARLGVPVAIINRGRTRGDAEASWRLEGDCAALLAHCAELVGINGVNRHVS